MEKKKLAAADFLELGMKLALDAAESVLSDPRGRSALSAASELAQKAVKKLEDVQATVVRAAGVPSQSDVRDLEERVEQLQRRARELGARLEAVAREAARNKAPPADRTPGPQWRDPDDPDAR
jgi:polyhydroxyalkanoate synthesis regulator phasin